MYEQLIEKLIKSDIGADVVDDTETITIPAYGAPPPEEFPWLIVAIVAGVAIVGAIAFAMFRK